MSPEICFYPHSWKGVFCKAFRTLNSNAFNCSWHYYCMTKYQHLEYCPVTLKLPQLGIYGYIKSIGKQVPYFQFPQLHIARILMSFGTWRASVLPLHGEFSQKSLTNLLCPCSPWTSWHCEGTTTSLTTSAPILTPYYMKENPGDLDTVPSVVWDWEREVMRWMCSAFNGCGSVQGHTWHKESFGKTLLGLEIPSASFISVEYFTEAVHSRTLLLVATSCQGLFVRRSSAQPVLTTLCFWHPFPFQPLRGDSQEAWKAKGCIA